MSLGEIDRRILWVRAGGRCTLCKAYLLEGDLSAKEVPLGEGAHVVGQKKSKKSARGMDDLPVTERDTVDNLMLACPTCHNEIDKQKVEGLIDVEFLRTKKREHEADIKQQTGLLKDRRTAIVRMAGEIRGREMEMPRDAAAEAVIRSSGRFPHFAEAYDRQGVEVDLRGLPGEEPLTDNYYETAKAKIDRAVDNQIRPAIQQGLITHLSVFAFARLPLLVYLGARLDDGFPLDVYQRHRSSGSWIWPDGDLTASFTVSAANDGDQGAAEGVLITNLSGTTPFTGLPLDLDRLPAWTLDVDGDAAEDVFRSPADLAAFVETVRAFFTGLESTHKGIKKLHVFGALPLSSALSFGLCLKSVGLRPVVALYDRTDAGYRYALEV
jgi:hypothetical protein